MIVGTLSSLRAAVDSARADTKHGTLARIGEALLGVQSVERSLRFIMTFVIQKDHPNGLDQAAYEAQTAAEREKTIGYFLAQLRHRATVEPSIDAHLATFLELRNKLVHHLDDVPGWGFDTKEGIERSNDFLTEVIASSNFVFFWLAGIASSYQEQTGMRTGFDDHPAIAILEAHFRPLAEWSLSPKFPSR